MSVKGTLDLLAFRIFFGNRSSLSSISTRTPAAASWSSTPWRYGSKSSATGTPSAWTGLSHTGKAPA